jgi:large subunit ribosomal protein L24
MKIKTGDTVMVMTGDKNGSRGKTGKVLAVSPKEGKVIVEGLNMVSKHVKPKKAGDPSGIIQAESAIYACKVSPYCKNCKKGTRVSVKVEDGKKIRSCAKCGKAL